MFGDKDVFTLQILEKTTDSKILSAGPLAEGFWNVKKTKKVALKRYSAEIIKKQLRLFVRTKFNLGSLDYLHLHVHCYTDSSQRTSLWATAIMAKKSCLCHAEADMSYV